MPLPAHDRDGQSIILRLVATGGLQLSRKQGPGLGYDSDSGLVRRPAYVLVKVRVPRPAAESRSTAGPSRPPTRPPRPGPGPHANANKSNFENLNMNGRLPGLQ